MASLSEMRRALETQHEEEEDLGPEEAELRDAARPKSRLAPSERGVTQTRSCLVEIEVPEGTTRRKGTLTFANTVGQLSRAGSSRGEGGSGPRRPPRRAPPRRAQSCIE